MKILFVHNHIFLKYKGNYYSDKLSYEVFSKYLNCFEEIYVFARCKEVENKPKISISSGNRIKFFCGDNINSIYSYLKNKKKVKYELEQIIKRIDGVIIRIPSEFGVLAFDIAKKYNKPIYTEVVACGWDALWNYGKFLAKIRAPFMFFKMKAIVKQSDFVLYVTEKFLQKRYPSSNNTFTIGLSDVEISNIKEDTLKKRLARIDSFKVPTIGIIASLKTKYKGVHILIKASYILKQKGYIFRVKILGDGNLNYYKKLVEKYGLTNIIFFDGVLPSGDPVKHWLDHIDIYVQPSYQEGLPRALIEAMSRGCPAIGSKVGGIPELLDEDYLIEPGDYNTLAKLIEKVITNKEILKKMAKENFNKAIMYSNLNEKRTNFLCKYKNLLRKK